jgi:hypothetical protein
VLRTTEPDDIGDTLRHDMTAIVDVARPVQPTDCRPPRWIDVPDSVHPSVTDTVPLLDLRDSTDLLGAGPPR